MNVALHPRADATAHSRPKTSVRAQPSSRPLIGLLSNPAASGNRAILPRIRAFCDEHPDIAHIEVTHPGRIGEALQSFERLQPKVLVLSGGDGTVQAALTELHHGRYFDGSPPPLAVLPAGKTNMIAREFGVEGDPVAVLERVIGLARGDLAPHIVSRGLISLLDGDPSGRPVIGLFLGGAALADTMHFCRHRIYPLGLPHSLAHALALLLGLLSIGLGRWARFLPLPPRPLRVQVAGGAVLDGSYAFLLVTTLQRLLYGGSFPARANGSVQMLLIDRRLPAMLRALITGIRGQLGKRPLAGVQLVSAPEFRITGARAPMFLDGELFEVDPERPLVIRPASTMPFLQLANQVA
ncbi:MAG: diacylglycerol/lipid kinase family protein [Sphingosinicella sp.]